MGFGLVFWWMCAFLVMVTMKSNIPVVYVMFGAAPNYFHINVELALRNNPVVILTDTDQHFKDKRASCIDMSKYIAGANAFDPIYKHFSKDAKFSRRTYEVQCFKRWFILRDYMKANQIQRVFFGDGDLAVFSDMTKAFDLRANCSAVINIEMQSHLHHWVGAGESSLWTLEGITSFCDFVTALYTKHFMTLTAKMRTGSTVTDMSALWLWWVATHNSTHSNTDVWSYGRPYQPNHCNEPAAKQPCSICHLLFDEAFAYAQSLSIPTTKSNLVVCNGLNVVQRGVFDHQHGWRSGSHFSLNLNGTGVPSFTGALTGVSGGIPDSLDENELKLQGVPIEMLTLHYQGNAKDLLPYDVCRVLLLTGGGVIKSPTVSAACEAETKSRYGVGGKWPLCRPHGSDNDGAVCV